MAALPPVDDSFIRMINTMAPPSVVDDSLARMIDAIAPPPVIVDSFSAVVADALRPSVEAVALTANSLAADMLRPCADIVASMNSSLAETLRPSADLFTPMSSALMTKPALPHSITLETLQAQIVTDKPRQSPAERACEALLATIGNFEANLDDDHEIGIALDSPGQSTTTIHVEGISYTDPDFINFHGRTDDKDMRQVQLMLHISQLKVMLVALEKQRPKAQRIGFIQDE